MFKFIKKKRDNEYLNGDDISTCKKCGDFSHIWHIWNADGDVVGCYCTNCFWTCGEATISDVIRGKEEEKILMLKSDRR